MKESLQNSLIIGIISGVVAGLILLFGQFAAEIYNQKYNIFLIAGICVGIVMIIIVFIAWGNSKK